MFLAQLTSDQIMVPFFLKKIEDVLVNNNSANKIFVDKVITESAYVVKGDKSLYDIDNDYYDIVKILIQTYSDKLINLNTPNRDIYLEIKNIFA